MIAGHVLIATSLDGFVAGPSLKLDWLMKQKTEGEDHGYDAFVDTVDGLVMSRTLTQENTPEATSNKVELTKLEPPQVM